MEILRFKRGASTDNSSKIAQEVKRIQEGDEAYRNGFIEKYRNFILGVAGRVKGSHIEIENDEEYSVALLGFNKAINRFDPGKNASFFFFAAMLIKREIIDYYRKNRKHQVIPFSQIVNDDAEEVSLDEYLPDKTYKEQDDQFNLQQEIAIYKTLLEEFSITFEELVRVSPKHIDTRKKMVEISKMLADHQPLKLYIMEKKKLPMQKILPMAGVSRKTLERHRKYILANFILINSDLEYLKEYIKDILQGSVI